MEGRGTKARLPSPESSKAGSKGRGGLRHLPLSSRPGPERLERGRADAVDAAVDAEEEVPPFAGHQVAAAVRALAAVAIVLLDVPADVVGVNEDVAARAQKEEFGNHGPLLLNLATGIPVGEPRDQEDHS